MSEIINFTNRIHERDVVMFAGVVALAEYTDKCVTDFKNKDVTVKLTFDGVEVPFTPFLKRFEKSFNHSVETEAHRIIKDRLEEIDNLVLEMKESILAKLEEQFPDRDKISKTTSDDMAHKEKCEQQLVDLGKLMVKHLNRQDLSVENMTAWFMGAIVNKMAPLFASLKIPFDWDRDYPENNDELTEYARIIHEAIDGYFFRVDNPVVQ